MGLAVPTPDTRGRQLGAAPASASCQPALQPGHAGPAAGGDWRRGLPVLRGTGVTLREPRLADAGALFASLTTREVTRFISTPPGTVEGFERFISWVQHERQLGRHLCFAVVPDGSADAVGLIQMREIEPGFGTAEWGFALAERYWGSGLFLTCARPVVDFVFRHIGVHRLEARASVRNGRGNGVLQKIGAVPEGVLRQSFSNSDVQTDQLLWSIIADDWQASQAGPMYDLHDPVTGTPEAEMPQNVNTMAGAWRRLLPGLRGDGVLLRELDYGDAETLVSQFRDAELGRYIPPPPTTSDAFARFVTWAQRQREAGQFLCFAVVPDGDVHAAGIFQVHQMEPPFRTAEWGFVFGRPHWGTGLFLRSARPLLDFLFDQLGVKRLEARAMAANSRANGVLRKLGAIEEGRLRRSFLLGGQYYDDVLWSILDSEWDVHRRPPVSA